MVYYECWLHALRFQVSRGELVEEAGDAYHWGRGDREGFEE